eukprot:TRINITY_DN5615_c0_g1_i2.p1 TRINITY_DN5615_c0_g1~~TRINITY_DN5615_c0_g1_i2.p1  ORF type:complete len:133 (-),score=27.03 TRINITY_DN5615_c0_g1_i2:81-479(-)
MDTKAFEVLIHGQYAFDACRDEVYAYEDCRQTDSPVPRDPAECETKSRAVLGCFRKAERVEPICIDSFNDARECLFKADGNLFSCKDVVNEYVYCQKDPLSFKNFLAASTKEQRKPRTFDFIKFRGTYDKFH